jgi:hypothetical protein
MRIGQVIRILAAPLLALVLTAGGGAAASGPYVVLNDTFYVRPSFTFEISRATANSFIGRSHWSTWGARGATARTTLFTNTCKPNCSEGFFKPQPAQVHLFNLTHCRGKQVFSEFVVMDRAGEPLMQGSFRSLGYLRRC